MKRTKNEKRFGVQIDSLSDLICFGVLPSLIGYYCSDRTILHIIISSAYLLCALIRLAWFNVDEENRHEKENSRFSKGMEKGHFELAGSTIILLFEKEQMQLRPELLYKLSQVEEGLIFFLQKYIIQNQRK